MVRLWNSSSGALGSSGSSGERALSVSSVQKGMVLVPEKAVPVVPVPGKTMVPVTCSASVPGPP